MFLVNIRSINKQFHSRLQKDFITMTQNTTPQETQVQTDRGMAPPTTCIATVRPTGHLSIPAAALQCATVTHVYIYH